MANAVPVGSKSAKKQIVTEVVIHDSTGDEKADAQKKSDLMAKAKVILASEVPEVPDELVNSIGQASNYGKTPLKVSEQPYDVLDRKGEPTGQQRVAIRIDH